MLEQQEQLQQARSELDGTYSHEVISFAICGSSLSQKVEKTVFKGNTRMLTSQL